MPPNPRDRSAAFRIAAYFGTIDASNRPERSGRSTHPANNLPQTLRREEIYSANFPLVDWNAHFEDFAGTSALIAQLDLVISIDTAVAHLAGAMGKPVWLLLRYSADWRWLLNRDDSPWYPGMRLFRQPKPGDWQAPIRRVVEALRAE